MPETQAAPQTDKISCRKPWQTPLMILSEIENTRAGTITAVPESGANFSSIYVWS